MREAPIVNADDQHAAQQMLNHAFRHASARAFGDVRFADIALAFAAHREESNRELKEQLDAATAALAEAMLICAKWSPGGMAQLHDFLTKRRPS